MGTVTISANVYTIYGSRTGANTYWAGLLGDQADEWATQIATSKPDKALNQATQLLDRQSYITGYTTFAERDAVAAFQNACYQLAGEILLDPDVATKAISGTNIEEVEDAAGDRVKFFSPTLGMTGRFSSIVSDLIGQYLAGNSDGAVSGSFVSGTDVDQTSNFAAADGTGLFETVK